MVAVVIAVSFVNVRYRAIAPSTAKSRNLTHVCCYVNYAALIGKYLKPYCEKGLRDIGDANKAPCIHDQFPSRMKYYLQKKSPR
jgi:hypothetical protein